MTGDPLTDQVLIARESGGWLATVAAEPATELGAQQPDGRRPGCARGLTQTIPTTFAQFHQAGTSTNSYDPIANIHTSTDYVMQRYRVNPGCSNLVVLMQQADPHRPPRGS